MIVGGVVDMGIDVVVGVGDGCSVAVILLVLELPEEELTELAEEFPTLDGVPCATSTMIDVAKTSNTATIQPAGIFLRILRDGADCIAGGEPAVLGNLGVARGRGDIDGGEIDG